ncbi:MAG: 3-ketoacyl-ACP reductase [Pseudonocardiales bacterium]|nr:3-ketoacyl-ACP reductase [Pseudonocardiales bacterium]
MAGRVAGKVAFITGAARGQGRSHAIRLAEEGADIIAVDICEDLPESNYPLSTPDDLKETVAAVEALDRRIIARKADVRDRNALAAVLAEGVAEFGHLDIVVANAGIAPLGKEMPPKSFLDVMDINFVGVFNAINAAYDYLPDGASIIATGSIAALLPGGTGDAGPGSDGYSHAKRSVAELVHKLSLTLAPRMIRVNAVHPTNCNTGMLQSEPMYRQFRPDLEDPTAEQAKEAFYSMQAMPVPWVEPVDISNAVVYLASDESRYVSGLQLKVDAAAMSKYELKI